MLPGGVVEQRIVPTRQGNTFVVVSGNPSSRPVVLLHGSGANSAWWMRDATAWAQHHRVYAVDVIGEPGLSAPSRPPLASPAYAEWLDGACAEPADQRTSRRIVPSALLSRKT
jgi:pimeloyl-ACP methyl ester carboxylesterase